MTLGRIGGPMLKSNLERQGVDLAFETDLVYLDVNNMRVGINQAVPAVDLHVDGSTRSGNVQLGGNTISSTDSNGNINITPNGTGSTVLSRISTPNVLTSTLASGTAPFIVTSTTQVANLNVANAGHSSTANTVVNAAQSNITSLGTLTGLNVNAQANATVFSSNIATGTAPFIVQSTTQVANLNVAAAGTATTAGSATTAGTVTTAAQPNITSVGVLTSLDVDNININGNTISSTNSNGNINLDPNGTGQVKLLGTNAVTLPVGTTAERPSGVSGDLRLNTTSNNLEFFNGTSWVDVASASYTITSDQFTGDGSTTNFTLSESSTTDSIIVAVNGVVQLPGDAYSASSTTLSFVEAPTIGDVISVRYLASATATSALQELDTSVTVNGVTDLVNVTVGGSLIAQFTTAGMLPGANITYDLGSSTQRWNDLWLAGTTIRLGTIVLKDSTGSFGIFQSDGTTPASIAGSIATAGTVTTAAQPNITSVGNLTIANIDNIQIDSNTVSSTNTNGNINLSPNGTGQVVSSGIVNATRFVSNIATGTAPFTVTSTTQVANLNVATAGSATTAGTVTTAAQPNITSTGTLTNLQVTSLGVGTAASGTSGEIRATNEVTAYYGSDLALKTNITLIDNALDKLRQISGVMFDWTDDEIARRGGEDGYFVRKHDTGVIAQEVEAVLPEVVAVREDGFKAVKYEKLAGLIIQAINELADKVDELKKAG